LYLLATGLDRGRYEPLVVLPDARELAVDLRGAGVEVLVAPVSVIRRGLLHPRGVASLGSGAMRDAVKLGRVIRRRRVALVHSNTSVVLGGAGAAAAARVPHIWHVREIYSRFGRVWPAYRRVLQTASALPCVSRATAAQFPLGGRVQVISDGLAVSRPRVPRARARAELGLDPDTPTIAVLGRVSDWKGQDVLVRALAHERLHERGVIGLIAGDPWPGAQDRLDAVLALAAELGVSDRLRLLGFREDVETIYGAADIVAVPSTQPDPLPGAAIEAAAAGCAVLASAHGGLPEIISDGATGRLVAPGDGAAFARTARELLDDPEQRARLGAAAARNVRERFSTTRLLEAVQSLYDSVLDRSA